MRCLKIAESRHFTSSFTFQFLVFEHFMLDLIAECNLINNVLFQKTAGKDGEDSSFILEQDSFRLLDTKYPTKPERQPENLIRYKNIKSLRRDFDIKTDNNEIFVLPKVKGGISFATNLQRLSVIRVGGRCKIFSFPKGKNLPQGLIFKTLLKEKDHPQLSIVEPMRLDVFTKKLVEFYNMLIYTGLDMKNRRIIGDVKVVADLEKNLSSSRNDKILRKWPGSPPTDFSYTDGKLQKRFELLKKNFK